MNNDKKELYAEFLRYIILEIRSLDDEKLFRARDLANIVHNLPTALVDSDANWDNISGSIRSRAAAHNLELYIEGIISHISSAGNADAK
ncbi:hypothetical protein [Brevundimonas sp.]|uniref:hypothetical protein n=1 Tax=Brevundimonas sp. TaxID=1871086 RepID=UPI0035B146B0